MPRGISKTKALQRELSKVGRDVPVPKGADKFPGTEIAIPMGIAIRSSSGVQIEFMYEGVRHYETIRGKPTVGHVNDAVEKRERVQQLIGLNTFDYEKEFPDSPKARAMRQTKDAATEPKNIETVASALNAWLVVAKPSVGHNAAIDYTKDAKRLMRFPASALVPADVEANCGSDGFLGDIPANALDDVGITCLQSWLLRQPGQKAGSTLSEKRVTNLMIPLRGAMERLAENGTIQHNPFNNVRPIKKKSIASKNGKSFADDLDAPLPIVDGTRFKESDIVVEPFSPDEVAAILGQLSGSFLNQMVFWFWTGLRTGEVIALRWSDIDWQGDSIYVRRSLSRGHLKLPKFDKKRWVKLCMPARKALEEQFKLTGQGEGWVFTNPFTKKMWANESKICSRFTKAAERAGVRYRRPYNCRHTYASVMLSSGENPLYVAEQMGHADWSMVIEVYGRWMKDVDLLAGQRVATMQAPLWQSLTELVASNQGTGEASADDMETVDEGALDEEAFEF